MSDLIKVRYFKNYSAIADAKERYSKKYNGVICTPLLETSKGIRTQIITIEKKVKK